jgi:hypothetical protein
VRPGEVVLRFPNGAVQTVGLWSERIHNGGHRTFFYLGGRRARRLWLAPDELWFRDPESLGLEYAYRRMGKRGRERLRDERIVEKLGPPGLDGCLRRERGHVEVRTRHPRDGEPTNSLYE